MIRTLNMDQQSFLIEFDRLDEIAQTMDLFMGHLEHYTAPMHIIYLKPFTDPADPLPNRGYLGAMTTQGDA